ncbi:MAG: hypothetical protein R3B82_24655 [Sandaracinaceae bacterium]
MLAVLDDADPRSTRATAPLEGRRGAASRRSRPCSRGFRRPSRGLALLRGLTRRRGATRAGAAAVAAPQFHDNRVIAGTFAFNLLLGRDGLATEEALAEAHALCVELGLGPLLERMPAGLLQQVGESGWQLSHGERSRLYLARAPPGRRRGAPRRELRRARSENQRRFLACALARAPTLVVIAHP